MARAHGHAWCIPSSIEIVRHAGEVWAMASASAYSPAIVPRHARRSKSLEVLIPILYLKGISTGDFEEAAGGPPRQRRAGPVGINHHPPQGGVTEEHARWQKRDLSAKRQSIAGPTASIRRPGSSTGRSASWSSSARRLRARRNSSASPTACARSLRHGADFSAGDPGAGHACWQSTVPVSPWDGDAAQASHSICRQHRRIDPRLLTNYAAAAPYRP